MALIKGKQIQSLEAAKVIETNARKFVSQSQIDLWNTQSSGGGYVKSIVLAVAENGQTAIETGIRMDGTGDNCTGQEEITLTVNGMVQAKGTDYTVAVVDNQIVITWLDASFVLDKTDSLVVKFNQIA